MKHVSRADFGIRTLGAPIDEELTPPRIDSLSRDLAVTAARLPDPRLRLLAAMQLLGNLRDFLVADISPDAERALDDAIQALMRQERLLPAGWQRS